METSLPSRRYHTPEDFVQDFLASLTPGIIPRSDFVKWDFIEEKVKRLASAIEFYRVLRDRAPNEQELINEITDSLLASDNPLPYVKIAFEILGHTNADFVSRQDDIDIEGLSRSIASGSQHDAMNFAELIRDLGFHKVLLRDDLEDVLFGVQVGLETHRRKNVGGEFFKNEVWGILKKVSDGVHEEIQVTSEVEIKCGNRLSKKVDFAILFEGKCRFGVEANFYTVSGSKPTEIKRSYGDVRRRLLENNIELIWITDGRGYKNMQRSLRDAYIILPNIYNLNHARKFLLGDIASSLQES
jgi:hypothetical protein